jgi:glutathione S-transferase
LNELLLRLWPLNTPGMSLPVLYSFRRCPYAIRARLAIETSGMVCELREITLRHKPAEMLAASPKGTVPVLVLPQGEVIEESLEIMHWALHRHDPEHWLPDTPEGRKDTHALIEQCDGPFKYHLDRYKYPNRYDLINGLADRDKAAKFLYLLEGHLTDKGFLIRPSTGNVVVTGPGFADMAIAPFVRQFAHTDPLWFASQPWPKLKNWLASFETSTRFQKVMEKYPVWDAGGGNVHLFPPKPGLAG